ncbi:hypothetical protein R3P38DRAFT_2771084 [Favolaschia claudopus]|uniref:Uncharacterized protein n=1 Tax=Favolaschia claudopus TaxID=2862362 RepID=A0AAW0CDL2_9AGAR
MSEESKSVVFGVDARQQWSSVIGAEARCLFLGHFRFASAQINAPCRPPEPVSSRIPPSRPIHSRCPPSAVIEHSLAGAEAESHKMELHARLPARKAGRGQAGLHSGLKCPPEASTVRQKSRRKQRGGWRKIVRRRTREAGCFLSLFPRVIASAKVERGSWASIHQLRTHPRFQSRPPMYTFTEANHEDCQRARQNGLDEASLDPLSTHSVLSRVQFCPPT